MPPKGRPRRQPPPHGALKTNEPQGSSAALPDKGSQVSDNEQQDEPLGPRATDISVQSLNQDAIPLSQPATTAAANSGSPPRRRLASFHSRKSMAPPVASDSRPAGLKYQPKAYVRRTKEEREAAERAEAERRQQRLAEGRVPVPSSSDRGSFQGRGGRGSYSGPMQFTSRGDASGHLGGSSIEEGGRKKKNFRGGGLFTTTRAGPTGAKNQPKIKPERDRDGDFLMGMSSTGRRQAIKAEGQGPTYVSSDEEPDLAEGPRVNIEHINLVSDNDTDGEKSAISTQDKGKEVEKDIKIPGWTLKPIRIDRHEHVERVAGINTDMTSLTSAELRRRAAERENAEGSLFIEDDYDEPAKLESSKAKGRKKPNDVEFVRDERRWQGVYQDDDDKDMNVRIKTEPMDYDDPMIFDDMTAVDRLRPSLQADSGALVPERADTGVPDNPNAEKVISQREKKRSLRIKSRLVKPVLQTEEERQEWVRYEEDLRVLGEELGSMKTNEHKTHQLDLDGDLKIDGEPYEDAKDRREGLAYLFQLPPIMPRLLSADEKATLLTASKPDDAADEQQQQQPPQQQPQDKKPSDPKSSQAPDLKQKMSEAEETLIPDTRNPNIFMAEDAALPKGCVGRLRVHDTGRVTATWGGVSLELNRGGGGGLLQEVVMTDYERKLGKVDEGGKDKDKKERWDERISLGEKGWAVGQLGGGFVMVPDWEKMFSH